MSEAAENKITIADFKKAQLRTGKVLEARPHPNADKLLLLQVDLGEAQPRQVIAGVRAYYEPEQMVGKTIIVVANLETAVLRGEESQGMLLAATDQATGNVVLLQPERDVAPGSEVR